MVFDGVLMNWYFHPQFPDSIVVEAYCDRKGRFADGAHVMTSAVVEVKEWNGKQTARTLNSQYLLVNRVEPSDPQS